MTKLLTEKAVHKMANRISDLAHELAQDYIKLTPRLLKAQKDYDVAQHSWEELNSHINALAENGCDVTWPVMMADLRLDLKDVEELTFDLGDAVGDLEDRVEYIDWCLYNSERSLH